ncbi:DUF4878 domain-containing protein [Candidatus Sumerlaeota bacterium]|nr:DUF4878 domain-containing protein [Candidatus Sumerlaeota bacterium]
MFEFLKKEIHLKVSRKLFYLVIVPGFALVVIGGSYLFFSSRSGGGEKIIKVVEVSPSEIVKEFFQYLHSGDIDRARPLMTLRYLKSPGGSSLEANKRLFNLLTAEKKVAQKSKIKIISEERKNNYAVVKIEQIILPGKKKFERPIYLVRDGNYWYIASIGILPPSWQPIKPKPHH